MLYTSVIDILTDTYDHIRYLREMTDDDADKLVIQHYEITIDLLRKHAEKEGI